MRLTNRKCLFALLLFSLVTSVNAVLSWWTVNNDKPYPLRGDFDFYLNTTRSLTPTARPQHPLIPSLLFALNMFIDNSVIVVLGCMVAGYMAVHLSSGLLTLALTQNEECCFICYVLTVLSTGFMLSPTALKNLVALAFLFTSYFFLFNTKIALKLRVIGTALFSLLTALSHTIPILLFVETLFFLSIYLFLSRKQRRRAGIVLAFMFGLGLFSLLLLNYATRTHKLAYFTHFLLSDPLMIFTSNILRLTSTPLIRSLTFFLVAFVLTLSTRFRSKHIDVALLCLLAAVATLLFLPPPIYADRLQITATPLTIIILVVAIYKYRLGGN